ncbi:MAG: beta-ketoacyl synthase chain length factor [bacterium]|nr:beta-ketoacyl synthase chain length factor [bacterium]
MFLESHSLYLPGLEPGQSLSDWGGPVDDAGPLLAFLEAKQRRRLSKLDRLVLQVAHQIGPPEVLAERVILFASRHGEIGTTLKLLHQWTQGESLSPAGFSHSVHNAPAGRLSILTHNHQPASTVSMGCDSLQAGLIEAASLLARYPERRVLLLLADEPLAAPLDLLGIEPIWPSALALDLSARVGWRLKVLPGTGAEPESAMLRLVRWIEQGGSELKLEGEQLGLLLQKAN